MALEKVSEKTIQLATETLTGDVRDAILGQIRALQKPYARCSQDEQHDVIDHAARVAANLAEQAVRIIASHGRNVILATLESMNVKDGIKAVVKCANQQSSLIELGDCVGKSVFIVVADKEAFTGEREPVNPEPDQKIMPLHLAKDGEGEE